MGCVWPRLCVFSTAIELPDAMHGGGEDGSLDACADNFITDFCWLALYPSTFTVNMAANTRLEAMNASPHHPKVKVTLKLADKLFVAGGAVCGKMEVECKADRGLGFNVIMAELFAVEGMFGPVAGMATFTRYRRINFSGPLRNLDVPPQ